MHAGLTSVRVRGFRSARDLEFAPGPVAALVGEAKAGKSNLLRALWALLDPASPPFTEADLSRRGDGTISIEATLGDGSSATLEARPPEPGRREAAATPPVMFMPSALRTSSLVASAGPEATPGTGLMGFFLTALEERGAATEPRSDAVPALSLLHALEESCSNGVEGVVFLIEEPELFLRPQGQRYLYRLLRRLASAGNQVIYSTSAPTFLNVGRLNELAFVWQDADRGSKVVQPEPLGPDEVFRMSSEFDAERSELFLARAAVLVEGRTEKLVLPFVFRTLGRDPDREAITIVECGGKSNIPVFARICEAIGVPFVVIHDRDAVAGEEPNESEQTLNALIATLVPRDRIVMLEPDFEMVAGLGGHRRKPERAWNFFASLSPSEVPEPLARAAQITLELLGKGQPGAAPARHEA